MSFEPPQKGNPHQLTINQHTFPKASIDRFTAASGRVQLFFKDKSKVLPVKPTDQLFCAQRVWDQSAESGYMKAIEDAFQALAGTVVDGRTQRFDLIEQTIISTFYCLWGIRTLHKRQPTQDQRIVGVTGLAQEFTKDDQERLEVGGLSPLRPDLTIAGRFLATPTIYLNLKAEVAAMGDAEWGILRATDGEFVVPDSFTYARAVPISPTLCLWSQTKQPVEMLDRDAVAEINQIAIFGSAAYFFARDLSNCPI
ncbi:hypothetical protein [Pseudomonas guariconensis]|uniref:hypothetical protein n=1 Tax=Pseudomonas guariconensis TaxID=1288410 RepID=UPI00209BB88C|nr:hypothetical protein [Pseudomonas guariconensis]MCO7620161.1 hypothetical protein [Pseudomonas guariconensis]